MGMFFTNLHVFCPGGLNAATAERIADMVARDRGWKRVDSPEEADVKTILGQSEGSPWVTVVSDAFDSDPDAQLPLAHALSDQLQAPVMAMFNFDSDFLFINHIDSRSGKDLWAYAGEPAIFEDEEEGFPPADYAAWEGVVPDVEAFEQVMTQEFIFSEDCLYEVEPMFQLPAAQSTAGIGWADELPGAQQFYYALVQDEAEPPRFESYMSSSWASCGKSTFVRFVNRGADTRGIDVILAGDDLVQGALTVADAVLSFADGEGGRREQPLTFAPTTFADGMTRLRAHVPELPVKGVPKGLPPMKEMGAKEECAIFLQFTLRAVDEERTAYAPVTVFMVPLANWAGQGARQFDVKG